MKNLAPICLFVYNRPWHTIQTIEALKNNILAIDSDLYIYSDGPKNDLNTNDVNDVRSYIKTIKGFKNTDVILRDKNLGLANNIISGVTEIIKRFGKIIVLEDDLIASPYFLTFMNDALDLYKDDEDVASIHGYVYPIENLPDTFFLKGADCWGWATWERAWNIFEANGLKILNEIKQRKIEKEIDFNNSVNYMKMLKNQIKGRNDSWAIRWHLAAYLRNKFTLYPSKSFIKNIGHDYSGQHSVATNDFDPIMCENYMGLTKIPILEKIDLRERFEAYFIRTKKSKFVKGFNYLVKYSNINYSICNTKKFFKKILYYLLPPLLFALLNNFLNKRWHGNYHSWDEAKAKSTGYDSEEILKKVYQSLYKVKSGFAVYERDSVIFDKIYYSWPLLTCLMIAAAKNNGKINVFDFGGSLGSTYYQNRKILDHFNDVKWCIVEQQHFVNIGKRDFESERLKFYLTVDDCLKEQKPTILILSSVLQYLEEPYSFISSLISQINVDYILIDRTPFTINEHRIAIQTVPQSIYKASYPCHIFNMSQFKTFFSSHGYTLIEEFDALDGYKKDFCFKGLIYFREKT